MDIDNININDLTKEGTPEEIQEAFFVYNRLNTIINKNTPKLKKAKEYLEIICHSDEVELPSGLLLIRTEINKIYHNVPEEIKEKYAYNSSHYKWEMSALSKKDYEDLIKNL